MNVVDRIRKLVTANINHLLDQAEDPEVMVKQMIRDMEESIIELRRETVRAVAREKQIQRQLDAAGAVVGDLEEQARTALRADREDLARPLVAKKLHTERTIGTLQGEVASAAAAAAALKLDLGRLEDQVQEARRKRDDLVRRRRLAEGQRRGTDAVRRSGEAVTAARASIADLATAGRALDVYEAAVNGLECEVAAEREILEAQLREELDLQRLAEDRAIDGEIARLRGE
jgi:phage shock protein A